ncbi:MAG TPA: carboxypeptidase-like regulatory domain-containing protein [Candidatus Acidoferrum sp.]|nr:carboxypeptidase-like regulatory domain-containing protein [Candidatus Acidoferrum sp.]
MQCIRAVLRGMCGALCLLAAFALFVSRASAQTDTTAPATPAITGTTQPAEPQAAGTIRGVVADKTNTAVAAATITLTRADSSAVQQTTTDDKGEYVLGGVAPGLFNIVIAAPGFASQAVTGELHAGETYNAAPVMLEISTVTTEVNVTMSHVEIAEAQIKEEEKQRVLGFVPNYYVSYVPDAASLNTKQKFELAWKTTVNPITFALTGAAAGLEQLQDQYGGYGQGAQGYGKRYGATYADVVTGNFIGGALLPSLFKQDPRYFYKGTGSKKSRVLYALANSVITKGDNGKWQPNYSGLMGSMAAGGISNLYYPASDRGAGLTFENVAITIAAGSAANILQEFLIRKLTPNANSSAPHP